MGELWPVYEFRPLPEHSRGTVLRYADGAWLPDDGEFDLAFVSYGMQAPLGLSIRLPHQRNIIWSGLTGNWHGEDHDHPRHNPWHYMLREGETEWGGNWDLDRHPNEHAGNRAMGKCCAINRCANGRGPEFKHGDKYIMQGLVRERESKLIVEAPRKLSCMYCGDAWERKLLESADA